MKTASTTTTTSRHPVLFKRRKAGVAISDLLIVLTIVGCVGLSISIVAPRLIRAGGVTDELLASDEELQPAQREVFDRLNTLNDQSAHTLAILEHAGDAQLVQWLIYWVSDDRYPGQINPSEIMILRHSATMNAVFAYAFVGAVEDDHSLSTRIVREPSELERLVSSSGFEMRLVGRGVRAIHLASNNGQTLHSVRTAADTPGLRLRLTWESTPTDTDELKSLLRADLPAGW